MDGSVREIYFDTMENTQSSVPSLPFLQSEEKEPRMLLILGLMWNIFVAALVPAGAAVWVVHPEFFGIYAGLEWSWNYDNTTDGVLANWKSFNWHPVMMTLAFGFFSTIALPTYALMPCEHKRGMKVTHILFQSLALSCAIFGVWIAFNFKEHVRGLPEMASVHSWIGFGSIVFFAIQVALGFFFFVFVRLLCKEESKFVRKTVMHMHKFLGFCFYCNTVIAMITGIYGRQWIYITKQNPDADVYGAEFLQANLLVLLVLVALFTVFYIVQYCLPVKRRIRKRG